PRAACCPRTTRPRDASRPATPAPGCRDRGGAAGGGDACPVLAALARRMDRPRVPVAGVGGVGRVPRASPTAALAARPPARCLHRRSRLGRHGGRVATPATLARRAVG